MINWTSIWHTRPPNVSDQPRDVIWQSWPRAVKPFRRAPVYFISGSLYKFAKQKGRCVDDVSPRVARQILRGAPRQPSNARHAALQAVGRPAGGGRLQHHQPRHYAERVQREGARRPSPPSYPLLLPHLSPVFSATPPSAPLPRHPVVRSSSTVSFTHTHTTPAGPCTISSCSHAEGRARQARRRSRR